MKNLLMTLALVLSTVRLVAQTADNQHLIFKGVPIDGTLSEYVEKMKLNGFVVTVSEPGTSLLQGDFAGYKDCLVGVVTMKQKDLVSRIKVMFPERDDWSSLYGNYANLKVMLIQKYGQPTEVVEVFPSYPSVTNDGLKYTYAQVGECNYKTVFETPKGQVSLYIDNIDSKCFVGLSYTDKINGEIMKAKAIDDL
jgi:hypothetical protein